MPAISTSLRSIENPHNYRFVKADICDERGDARDSARERKIDAVMHLAAESHVDRSIDGPGDFIRTNVVGTFRLLDAALDYWRELPTSDQRDASASTMSRPTRCSAICPSTISAFTEETPYAPSSPYSASKAAADHLVRAWHATYGLPVVLSNCSNNYGPFQFPEKLIPLVILNALDGKPLPVYGKGANVRDWLHVEDHAEALARRPRARPDRRELQSSAAAPSAPTSPSSRPYATRSIARRPRAGGAASAS